jgi:hypothetical protein
MTGTDDRDLDLVRKPPEVVLMSTPDRRQPTRLLDKQP